VPRSSTFAMFSSRRSRRRRCRSEALHAGAAGTWYLTMNATKDALKAAPGYKYDKAKANWVPA
jgi:hypothetical protein